MLGNFSDEFTRLHASVEIERRRERARIKRVRWLARHVTTCDERRACTE